MIHIDLKLLLLMGLFLLGGVSFAQTANKTSPADIKQYGDWFYRCIDVVIGKEQATNSNNQIDKPVRSVKQCEVAQIQQVKRGEETVTVLSVAIALSAPEKAGQRPSLLMTSVIPLNVYLPAGLRYSVSGKDVINSNYRNCNQSGCWVQQKLDQKALVAFKKGNAAEAHFRLINGQSINIKFSLNGLSNALSALEKGTGVH